MSYEGLLINKCDLVFPAETDQWGEPIGADTVIELVKCRIMIKNRLVRNFKGEEVVSTATIFFLVSQTLNHTVKVKNFRDAKGIIIDKREHSILGISEPQDSVKTHHKEAFLD